MPILGLLPEHLEREPHNMFDGREQDSDISDPLIPTEGQNEERSDPIPKWKKYCGVAILFFINLLNYMDRYTIAGVLIQIQDFYKISNGDTGLLQTVFIISYMIFAPLFGYLGDRYNRKVIVVVGILFWCGFTLASSFVMNPELFPVFLLMRAMVGIGEASYATIAPTIIGDMFQGDQRTLMLTVFFFATPLGTGLGYIVGSQVAAAFGGWEWALRVTPAFGLLGIILFIFFCPNPARGASEIAPVVAQKNTQSYASDLKYLWANKTFVYVTVGFTFMAFVLGTLTLWGPTYVTYAEIVSGMIPPCSGDKCSNTHIEFVFGVIACVSGVCGVVIGAEWGRRWKKRGKLDADPIVCAIGMLLAAPLLFLVIHVPLLSIELTWAGTFFANLCLCLNWTLVIDTTLYVCEPTKRATANAVMMLIGHFFGDAGSPYLVGVIADALGKGHTDYMTKYVSLQRAMYLTLFASVASGWGFLIASNHVVSDKAKVDKHLQEQAVLATANSTRINGPTDP